MFSPNRTTLVLVLAALAAGALAGCEAGTTDRDGGRVVAAETAERRTPGAQGEAQAEAKDRKDERDGEDAADDRSATDGDDASAARDDASAVAAYAQAQLDARGQAEALPESYAHLGVSREFPALSPDLVIPESVAAAAAAAASEPDPNGAPTIDAVSPSTAPASGGSVLQIHGKNLHAYRVAVGFAPARILSVREAGGTVTLTVAAPPRTGPATVSVVVTNRDGSVAIASEPFQYVE